MSGRAQLAAAAVVVLCVLVAEPGARQIVSTMRLRGRVVAESGAAIQGAIVRTDAAAGVAGEQFAGQREFTATTDRKGQWNVLGITRGLWIFEVTAGGYAPHVVAIPIAMMKAPTLGVLPWRLSVALLSEAEVGALAGPVAAIARAAAAGARDEAAARLRQLPLEGASPEVLCAVGELCLLLRDAARARGLFARAAEARPDWYRPHLGSASAAILLGDYDAAAKSYWRARELARDSELQQALSAAIADLNLIARNR